MSESDVAMLRRIFEGWPERAAALERLVEQNESLRDGYLELEADQHSWSERPCTTCRKISETLGRDFGCQRYAQIHEAQTIMLRTGDPKKYRAALAVAYPASSPLALPVCPECAEGRHVYCLDDGSSTWTDKCRCTCRDEQSPASTPEAS